MTEIANTIQCHKRVSLPEMRTTGSSNSLMVFRKMRSHSSQLALSPAWNFLMIEPSEEISGMDFATHSSWEADLEHASEDVQGGKSSGVPSDQAETLTLYTVATSKKAGSAEATSGT